MIKDIRLDDRLIHGQVCGYWIPANSINKIVIVDDEIIKDKQRKSVLKFGCPNNVSLSFHSAEKTAEILNKGGDEGYNVMLLFRDPKPILDMVNAGYKINKVSVGNLTPKNKDDIHVKGTTYVDKDRLVSFKGLIDKGVEVILQPTPNDSPENLKDFFDKY